MNGPLSLVLALVAVSGGCAGDVGDRWNVEGSNRPDAPGAGATAGDDSEPAQTAEQQDPGPDTEDVPMAYAGPSLEGTRLLSNLKKAQAMAGFLFGQQHANWSSKRTMSDGSGWSAGTASSHVLQAFQSDIEILTKLLANTPQRKPAVYGFQLTAPLKNGEGWRRNYAAQIARAYESGGLVTIHWPAANPVTGGNDNTGLNQNILCHLSTDWSNPAAQNAPAIVGWKAQLAAAADFLELVNATWRAQTGKQGKVALVFRPLHEMLGNKKWWSAQVFEPSAACPNTADAATAYKKTWRKTYNELTAVHGVDNLVWAWSPQRPSSYAFKGFYPGDRFVDVIAFDIYKKSPETFKTQLLADLAVIAPFADTHDKVLAVAEFGHRDGLAYLAGDNIQWYADFFLTPLLAGGYATKIAYAMTWSNRGASSYWVPLTCYNVNGCETYPDGSHFYSTDDKVRGFKKFINKPEVLMLEEIEGWWAR